MAQIALTAIAFSLVLHGKLGEKQGTKKKEITAEAAARKEMIRGLLAISGANSMEDIMELFNYPYR